MREPEDREGADTARLFDVVLAEATRRDDAEAAAERLLAAGTAEREAAWRRAAAAEKGEASVAPARWWTVAAALLGVVVVAATMWWPEEPAAVVLRPPQDPAGARVTKPRDLAHFLDLLGTAKALRLRGADVVGATQVSEPDGSYDRLDIATWPEVVRIEGERLLAWRRAIVASAKGLRPVRNLGTWVALRFELPDGSELMAAVSAGEEIHFDPLVGEGVVQPDESLRGLIEAATAEVALQHRRGQGIALDAEELAALPADSAQVECPWFADGSLPARLARFPRLTMLVVRTGPGGVLDGEGLGKLVARGGFVALDLPADGLRPGDLEALAGWPSLTALTLRGHGPSPMALPRVVPGLTELTLEGHPLQAAEVVELRKLRRLRTLRLVNCDLPDSSALLVELASLPSLIHLTLRQRELPTAIAAPFVRSKLQSLRLIDMPVRGADVAPLAALPSLRELAVLSPVLSDADVQDLGALEQLSMLRLMNAKLTADGLAALQRELPRCAIDCVPGRRLFDSGTWILP